MAQVEARPLEEWWEGFPGEEERVYPGKGLWTP